MPYSKNKTSCSQTPTQNLQISSSMQQALKVLQMPIEDLTLWIQEKTEQNPLIEWSEEEEDLFEPSYTLYSKGEHTKLTTPMLIESPYKESLFEYLMKQARQVFTEKIFLEMAEWIIGNLESTGFYLNPFKAIPPSFSLEKFEICLREIKQFDPPGIAAASIQESLLLQLKHVGKENTLSHLLIEKHYEDLLAGNFKKIQKNTKKDEISIKKAIKSDIAPLNPFPGYHFAKKPNPPLAVDIFLIEEESFKVRIKEPPSITEKIYPNTDSLSSEDRNILKAYQTDYKWIIKAIEKRSITLKKIAEHLIKVQRDYLQGNSNILLPLSIQDVSKNLGLHESTITRAVADKNLSCSLGIIPLKSLFSKKLSNDISCDQAKKLLCKLIAEEDKKAPFSDRELLEKMRKTGIPCARRTVTKYRQILKIPSRHSRKT